MKKNAAFRKVTIGDSEEEVIRALGIPELKTTSLAGSTWWYLGGRVKVFFQGFPAKVIKTIVKVKIK